jgi:riboflavin kinase / FMN adenylyltransferase
MEIISRFEHIKKNRNCVLTTGTFDGVHLGHQTIIKELIDSARTTNACATIVTFEPHPKFVVKQKQRVALKLLSSIDEKIAILEGLGVDRLIILPFTVSFSKLSSDEFIENILIKKIGLNGIIIGYDHAFGKDRTGEYEIIKEFSNLYDFSIVRMPPFSKEDIVISSTAIRNLLSNGAVAEAANYLGRYYKITGRVISGEGRGKEFSVPTANIVPVFENKLIPQNGIYAGCVRLLNQKYKAVIYIGKKPTFSYNELSFEVYIFNFNGNIYNEILEVEFIVKVRDDRKFDNAKKLYTQIEEDKKKTLEILSNCQI